MSQAALQGAPRSEPQALVVIGLDGGPLEPAARDRLDGAVLVAGGARHLAAVEVPDGVPAVVMGDVTAALDRIDEALAAGTQGVSEGTAKDGCVVVLASGDPGFFGIVRALRARGHRPEVLPARSSVALAFAKAGLSWDDALVVSAHGRDLRRAVNACRAHPKVAVLTGPGAGPAELGRALFPQSPRTFVVCEDLGGPEERVRWCRPAEATTLPWREPNVVIVLARDATGPAGPAAPDGQDGARGWLVGARPGPASWALPEEEFEHRGSVITKAEVRAFVLARLGPRIGDLIWDIGAGSGSVAIECARFGAAVIAVERDEASCERMRRNVLAHRARVAVSRGTAPEVLEHLPDPDAVFVGGGGPLVVQACAERASRVVVVALAAIERVGPTMAVLRTAGFSADAVQLQAARLSALPGDVHRLAPTNPVFVVWGVRSADGTARPLDLAERLAGPEERT